LDDHTTVLDAHGIAVFDDHTAVLDAHGSAVLDVHTAVLDAHGIAVFDVHTAVLEAHGSAVLDVYVAIAYTLESAFAVGALLVDPLFVTSNNRLQYPSALIDPFTSNLNAGFDRPIPTFEFNKYTAVLEYVQVLNTLLDAAIEVFDAQYAVLDDHIA
jgi:hypothetical protein